MRGLLLALLALLFVSYAVGQCTFSSTIYATGSTIVNDPLVVCPQNALPFTVSAKLVSTGYAYVYFKNATLSVPAGQSNTTFQAYIGFSAGNATVQVSVSNGQVQNVTFLVTEQASYKMGWAGIIVVIVMCVVFIILAFLLAAWIMRQDDGTEKMREVSDPIKEGAQGFFKTQYITISCLAVPVAIILFVLYIIRAHSDTDPNVSNAVMAAIVAVSFLIGATFSGFAGLIGMWVAVRANIRVASAARNSYNTAVAIALRSGGFAGFLVVALSVLGVAVLFVILMKAIDPSQAQPQQICLLLVGYGFGASFVALFAQLGGGIYTKAADVGADIIGKVEANIPEDDVRNPAVVADLVGDNVGDCAGRGADLFESIAAENIGAMILAGTLAVKSAPQLEDPLSYIAFPLTIHIFGLLASWIGIYSVKVKDPNSMKVAHERKPLIVREDEESQSLNHENQELDDPMAALNRGYGITVLIATCGFIGATYWLLHSNLYPSAWWKFLICGVIGIIISWLFVFITIYYTDFNWYPVKRIAEASRTGAGTNVIAGISVGMESTAPPVFIICVGIISSYYIGRSSGLADASGTLIGGLFGTAVATMGMLSSAGFILAMDTFGPITDNAGGIVEMSQLPPEVRVITDRLDAAGNTTKALTKGYAIGSASLAAFLLFSAFLDEITAYTGVPFTVVNLASPEVFVGALIGAGLVFLFSALAIRAVGKSAETVIHEVRRQFKEKPGILTFEAKPDYARCVAIVARSALIQMILPGILPVLVPVAVGFIFRGIGAGSPDTKYLGAEVSAGFLMVATITGILMALFLNNGGGAWDNAKKYIEMGNEGGKGSDTHKAAIIGDTVGDPFKDTAGPSLHVLIKLLATITLVLGPLYLN